jgi:hypothetical protein
LNVTISDPNVVGKKKEEKELIKKFDQFYKLLIKSFRLTRTYQLGLIKIDRKVIRENGSKV